MELKYSLFCCASVFLYSVFNHGVFGFIVPDEIPSLLSVIYSNIPTIKKGTDSRIGWGFRLGDRADFQVLVELGPQKYTQPLANEPDKVVSNKRSALNDLATKLWIQRQEDKKKQAEKLEKEKKVENVKINSNDSASWLQNWSENVQKNQAPAISSDSNSNGDGLIESDHLGIGEIDAKSVIPDDENETPKLKNKENNVE